MLLPPFTLHLPPPWSSRALLVAGGSLTAVLLLVGAAAIALLPRSAPVAMSVSGESITVLPRVEVAPTEPTSNSATAAPAGGYRYQKKEGVSRSTNVSQQGGVDVLVPFTRETWIAADGSGRVRQTSGEPSHLTEKSRAALQAGANMFQPNPSRDFGPGGLRYEDFSRYPTNRDALVPVLQRWSPRLFTAVGDIWRFAGVPPQLAAALYEVAVGIPGVVVTDTTDRAGRPGLAVAWTPNHSGALTREVLIVDPKTKALLGEERIVLEKVEWIDAQPPVNIGYTVYLESKLVPDVPTPLQPSQPDKLNPVMQCPPDCPQAPSR